MSALASLMPPAAKSKPGIEPGPIFAAIEDEVTQSCVARIAEEFGWSGAAVTSGGIGDCIEHLNGRPTPNYLIVDVSGASDPLADLDRLASICDTDVGVLALGTENDVQLYRKIVSLGVSDYLVKPVSADELRGALRKMTKPPVVDGAAELLSPTTAFVGVRGGAGASTAAVSAAWLMAHRFGKNTALFDLDLNFGTAALMLDLEPGRGLSEALASPDRIDELFIARAMVRESENLMVLSAEESLEQSSRLDNGAVARMNELLREGFDEILWDVPRHVLQDDPNILSSADRVVVVSDASLAGLRDSKQIIGAVSSAAADARIVVAISQIGRFKGAEVEKADFEAAIGRAVDHLIPYDPKSVARAIAGAGTLPSAAGNGPAARALLGLVKDVAGFDEPKKSGISAMFKRG
ncbi:MAG: hypothetical protein QGH73_13060 [Rhodospirillales bacterium]|jgi:pilus assembly protein CpaE|nr:pilus assembly protein CpaE [Rhodospirillaceae bacterium]MDP6428988.1 hypothetical protein [Rhodospirillales bacterium]MDP6646709.1 hypothetical protein [Rhodospirillales bacterium]MDP6842600.1 hypothetical protein [Rhodospirillales bacterium]